VLRERLRRRSTPPFQSDNRGAGLAQGRHELRDDRGIESISFQTAPSGIFIGFGANKSLKTTCLAGNFLIGSLTTATPKPAATSGSVLANPPSDGGRFFCCHVGLLRQTLRPSKGSIWLSSTLTRTCSGGLPPKPTCSGTSASARLIFTKWCSPSNERD
jgi:hypothetical protein